MIRKILFVLVCGLLLPAIPSWAVPVNTNTSGAQTIQEANPNLESSGDYNLDWSYIYNVNSSSGVAIDDYWILTAHHVADDSNCNLTIGGTAYTALERIYNNDADLALIRYDKVLPGHYNYTTSTSFTGSEVIMIGFGYYGQVTQTNFSGSWNQQYEENLDVKRWGTNRVDGLVTIPDAFGDTYSALKTTISGTNSNTNPTPYETGVNTGDSGGGMFAHVGGEWILIGINTGRGGSPYNTTYSVPVGDYDTWITSEVPEPTTLGLLLIGGLVLLRRGRI